jgi:hypothetical protein
MLGTSQSDGNNLPVSFTENAQVGSNYLHELHYPSCNICRKLFKWHGFSLQWSLSSHDLQHDLFAPFKVSVTTPLSKPYFRSDPDNETIKIELTLIRICAWEFGPTGAICSAPRRHMQSPAAAALNDMPRLPRSLCAKKIGGRSG